MMKNDYLVSIVIPVYNVEKYVEKCLLSVINQTYKNLEIIVVNDGTKDNSLKICEMLKEKDARIKIINQENAGLSCARNTGIENASGEYICFVDSDDFLDKDFIDTLLSNALQNNVDICACDFWYIDESNKKWSLKIKKDKKYSNMEALKDILLDTQETEVMIWNKLYKLELFKKNNIRFPVGKLHEDNYTTYKLYYFSNGVYFVNKKLYYYLQRNDSIMGKKFNIKRLDILNSIDEKKEFFKKENINLKDELIFNEMSTLINLLNIMIRDKFNTREFYDIVEKVCKNKKVYLKNKYLNKKYKIALYLINKKAIVYKVVLKIQDSLKKRRLYGVSDVE